MKRNRFLIIMIVVLLGFVSSTCFADSEKSKKKNKSNTNRQSLETPVRGKERAEQRREVREEKGYDALEKRDADDDGEDIGEGKKKDKSDKYKSGDDESKNEKYSGDKDDDHDEDESSSSDEDSKSGNRRWWEIFKKSDE